MKINCSCGHQISTVSFPCTEEAHLITAFDVDNSANYNAKPITYNRAPFRHVYVCAVEYGGCGRLFVETRPRSNHYTMFIPLEGEFLSFREGE